MPTNTTTKAELSALRRTAADDFFGSYPAKEQEGIEITNSDAWNEDGPYWSRRVYGDGDDNVRVMFSFGVEFAPDSDKIVENWLEKIA